MDNFLNNEPNDIKNHAKYFKSDHVLTDKFCMGEIQKDDSDFCMDGEDFSCPAGTVRKATPGTDEGASLDNSEVCAAGSYILQARSKDDKHLEKFSQ